jgi:hypothetical protein
MASCGMRLGAWEFLRWKYIEPVKVTKDDKVVTVSENVDGEIYSLT